MDTKEEYQRYVTAVLIDISGLLDAVASPHWSMRYEGFIRADKNDAPPPRDAKGFIKFINHYVPIEPSIVNLCKAKMKPIVFDGKPFWTAGEATAWLAGQLFDFVPRTDNPKSIAHGRDQLLARRPRMLKFVKFLEKRVQVEAAKAKLRSSRSKQAYSLTVTQVAATFPNLSTSTVTKLCNAGIVKSTGKGRNRRVDGNSLAIWVNQRDTKKV